jgi:AraC-like ligand binding domain
MAHIPRQLKPELEHDYSRSPELGYERPEEVGIVRCLSHGYPTPLARWHCHDEYELHLITATSGKAFVGDWIGQFQPGHLVLTGPRLPHNWVTMDLPEARSGHSVSARTHGREQPTHPGNARRLAPAGAGQAWH